MPLYCIFWPAPLSPFFYFSWYVQLIRNNRSQETSFKVVHVVCLEIVFCISCPFLHILTFYLFWQFSMYVYNRARIILNFDDRFVLFSLKRSTLYRARHSSHWLWVFLILVKSYFTVLTQHSKHLLTVDCTAIALNIPQHLPYHNQDHYNYINSYYQNNL